MPPPQPAVAGSLPARGNLPPASAQRARQRALVQALTAHFDRELNRARTVDYFAVGETRDGNATLAPSFLSAPGWRHLREVKRVHGADFPLAPPFAAGTPAAAHFHPRQASLLNEAVARALALSPHTAPLLAVGAARETGAPCLATPSAFRFGSLAHYLHFRRSLAVEARVLGCAMLGGLDSPETPFLQELAPLTRGLPLEEVRLIALQLLLGVARAHASGVAFRGLGLDDIGVEDVCVAVATDRSNSGTDTSEQDATKASTVPSQHGTESGVCPSCGSGGGTFPSQQHSVSASGNSPPHAPQAPLPPPPATAPPARTLSSFALSSAAGPATPAGGSSGAGSSSISGGLGGRGRTSSMSSILGALSGLKPQQPPRSQSSVGLTELAPLDAPAAPPVLPSPAPLLPSRLVTFEETEVGLPEAVVVSSLASPAYSGLVTRCASPEEAVCSGDESVGLEALTRSGGYVPPESFGVNTLRPAKKAAAWRGAGTPVGLPVPTPAAARQRAASGGTPGLQLRRLTAADLDESLGSTTTDNVITSSSICPTPASDTTRGTAASLAPAPLLPLTGPVTAGAYLLSPVAACYVSDCIQPLLTERHAEAVAAAAAAAEAAAVAAAAAARPVLAVDDASLAAPRSRSVTPARGGKGEPLATPLRSSRSGPQDSNSSTSVAGGGRSVKPSKEAKKQAEKLRKEQRKARQAAAGGGVEDMQLGCTASGGSEAEGGSEVEEAVDSPLSALQATSSGGISLPAGSPAPPPLQPPSPPPPPAALPPAQPPITVLSAVATALADSAAAAGLVMPSYSDAAGTRPVAAVGVAVAPAPGTRCIYPRTSGGASHAVQVLAPLYRSYPLAVNVCSAAEAAAAAVVGAAKHGERAPAPLTPHVPLAPVPPDLYPFADGAAAAGVVRGMSGVIGAAACKEGCNRGCGVLAALQQLRDAAEGRYPASAGGGPLLDTSTPDAYDALAAAVLGEHVSVLGPLLASAGKPALPHTFAPSIRVANFSRAVVFGADGRLLYGDGILVETKEDAGSAAPAPKPWGADAAFLAAKTGVLDGGAWSDVIAQKGGSGAGTPWLQRASSIGALQSTSPALSDATLAAFIDLASEAPTSGARGGKPAASAAAISRLRRGGGGPKLPQRGTRADRFLQQYIAGMLPAERAPLALLPFTAPEVLARAAAGRASGGSSEVRSAADRLRNLVQIIVRAQEEEEGGGSGGHSTPAATAVHLVPLVRQMSGGGSGPAAAPAPPPAPAGGSSKLQRATSSSIAAAAPDAGGFLTGRTLTDAQAAQAADMWSIGCIVWALLTGAPPFWYRGLGTDTKDRDAFEAIVVAGLQWHDPKTLSGGRGVAGDDTVSRAFRAVWKSAAGMMQDNHGGRVGKSRLHLPGELGCRDPDLVDLLLGGLLHPDPAQRLTAAQALQHPFFEKLTRPKEGASSSGTSPAPVPVQETLSLALHPYCIGKADLLTKLASREVAAVVERQRQAAGGTPLVGGKDGGGDTGSAPGSPVLAQPFPDASGASEGEEDGDDFDDAAGLAEMTDTIVALAAPAASSVLSSEATDADAKPAEAGARPGKVGGGTGARSGKDGSAVGATSVSQPVVAETVPIHTAWLATDGSGKLNFTHEGSRLVAALSPGLRPLAINDVFEKLETRMEELRLTDGEAGNVSDAKSSEDRLREAALAVRDELVGGDAGNAAHSVAGNSQSLTSQVAPFIKLDRSHVLRALDLNKIFTLLATGSPRTDVLHLSGHGTCEVPVQLYAWVQDPRDGRAVMQEQRYPFADMLKMLRMLHATGRAPRILSFGSCHSALRVRQLAEAAPGTHVFGWLGEVIDDTANLFPYLFINAINKACRSAAEAAEAAAVASAAAAGGGSTSPRVNPFPEALAALDDATICHVFHSVAQQLQANYILADGTGIRAWRPTDPNASARGYYVAPCGDTDMSWYVQRRASRLPCEPCGVPVHAFVPTSPASTVAEHVIRLPVLAPVTSPQPAAWLAAAAHAAGILDTAAVKRVFKASQLGLDPHVTAKAGVASHDSNESTDGDAKARPGPSSFGGLFVPSRPAPSRLPSSLVEFEGPGLGYTLPGGGKPIVPPVPLVRLRLWLDPRFIMEPVPKAVVTGEDGAQLTVEHPAHHMEAARLALLLWSGATDPLAFVYPDLLCPPGGESNVYNIYIPSIMGAT